MKTSYKILIGVGIAITLYIVWELFLALKDSSSGNNPDNNDTSASGNEDYNAYLNTLAASASADGSAASSSSSGGSSSGVLSSLAKAGSKFEKYNFLNPVNQWNAIKIGFNQFLELFSSSDSSTASSSSATPSTSYSDKFNASMFPIQWGSNNSAVKQLQGWLNSYVYKAKTIGEDGIYGQQTNNALARFETLLDANATLKKNKSAYFTKSGSRYTISESQFKNIYNGLLLLGKN